MKPLFLCALSAAALFAASCGRSEKEKIAIQPVQQVPSREAADDSISTYNTLLTRQQKALIRLRAALYAANDEMTRLKGFHPGLPAREREMQIHSQDVKIQVLLLQQTNLQTAIEHSLDEIAQYKSALATAK